MKISIKLQNLLAFIFYGAGTVLLVKFGMSYSGKDSEKVGKAIRELVGAALETVVLSFILTFIIVLFVILKMVAKEREEKRHSITLLEQEYTFLQQKLSEDGSAAEEFSKQIKKYNKRYRKHVMEYGADGLDVRPIM